MLRAVLVCTLLVHCCMAKPLQQHGELGASHIVIVTPQAQVRLEPLPSAYLQHLSPFARYAAPSTHEETIVYVPAGSVNPVMPVPVPVSVAARSAGASAEANKLLAYDATKQLGNISQIQDITQQIQQSAGQWGPQLSEAASTGAQAIATAGQGFFPALFPPPSTSAAKIEYEAPLAAAAAQQQLLATEARHFYAIPSGVVPQVLDFVRGPVFVAPSSVPVSAGVVRSRSIKEAADTPPSACSSADMQKLQEEAKLQLQLQEQQKMQPLQQLKESQPLLPEPLKPELIEPAKEAEKKADFGRLLEAELPKEEKKEMSDKLELPLKAAELKDKPLDQPLQPELNTASNKLLEPQALPLAAAIPELPTGQLRSVGVVDGVVGGGVVADGVVGGGVVDGVGAVDVGRKGVYPVKVALVEIPFVSQVE